MKRYTWLVGSFTIATVLLSTAVVPVAADQAPGNKPATSEPQADPFKFTSDAAVLIWAVKADQAEAFESVWSVVQARLASSSKLELKGLGDGLKIFKAETSGNPQEAMYFMIANPASKTTSYELAPFLLFESGLFERPEADELFKLISTAIIRINPFPINAVKH